jgi:hypothetical protein
MSAVIRRDRCPLSLPRGGWSAPPAAEKSGCVECKGGDIWRGMPPTVLAGTHPQGVAYVAAKLFMQLELALM